MEISDPYLKYKYIVKKWENEFIKSNNRNPKKVIIKKIIYQRIDDIDYMNTSYGFYYFRRIYS